MSKPHGLLAENEEEIEDLEEDDSSEDLGDLVEEPEEADEDENEEGLGKKHFTPEEFQKQMKLEDKKALKRERCEELTKPIENESKFSKFKRNFKAKFYGC